MGCVRRRVATPAPSSLFLAVPAAMGYPVSRMDKSETVSAPIPTPPAWTVDYRHADERRFRQYARKHPREFDSCVKNMGRILPLLDNPGLGAFGLSFFRNEFGKVWRIGQTGIPHAREMRLYVYAAIVGRTLYPLTIGDKGTQAVDLAQLKKTATQLERNGCQ